MGGVSSTRLMIAFISFLAFISNVSCATNRSADATYQLIYLDIQSYLSCFRRFNGTHEIGCSTSLNGNVGTLHYINDTDSLEWLIDYGPHQPYIPLITNPMFTEANIRKLQESGKLNGLMLSYTDVYDTDSYPKPGFSSDLKCPNRQSDIYNNGTNFYCDAQPVNPHGNGLMFHDFKMPVMVLRAEYEVQKVIDCFMTHNAVTGNDTAGAPQAPLCSVELKAFMHGAGNTEICWRRNQMIRNLSPDSYCQQLGGKSSLVYIVPKILPDKHVKTIVITARSDSFSLFEYLQPGTSSPAAGLAVLLALTEALNKTRANIENAGYNVMILALTGESYDYIGSQKAVYDMKNGVFGNRTSGEPPFGLDDVELIIELSQLIAAASTSEVFMHTDPYTSSNHKNVDLFIDKLQQNSQVIAFKNSSSKQPLPPSSSQMFIRAREKGMPAVVLADYDKKFHYNYSNSYLDTPALYGFFNDSTDTLGNSSAYDNVTDQAQALAEIGTAIAKSILQYMNAINDTAETNVEVSATTVNHLLFCMLVNQTCELYRSVVSPQNEKSLNKSSAPFPFYTSVYGLDGLSDGARFVILHILAYFTGSEMEGATVDNCNTDISFWVSGEEVNGTRKNVCLNTTAQYTNTYSPAFDIQDYNFSSGEYSTWTESVWPNNDPFHVKIFLRPSLEVELASMVAGISVFLVSALAVLFTYKRANILFPPHMDTASGQPSYG